MYRCYSMWIKKANKTNPRLLGVSPSHWLSSLFPWLGEGAELHPGVLCGCWAAQVRQPWAQAAQAPQAHAMNKKQTWSGIFKKRRKGRREEGGKEKGAGFLTCAQSHGSPEDRCAKGMAEVSTERWTLGNGWDHDKQCAQVWGVYTSGKTLVQEAVLATLDCCWKASKLFSRYKIYCCIRRHVCIFKNWALPSSFTPSALEVGD